MQIEVKFFKVLGPPSEPVPNAVYFVELDDAVEIYVTDEDGDLKNAGSPDLVMSLLSWANISGRPEALLQIAGLEPSNGDFLIRHEGEWTNRTTAQAKTLLGTEDIANKATDFSEIDDTKYPTVQAVETRIDSKVSEVTSPVLRSPPLEGDITYNDDDTFADTGIAVTVEDGGIYAVRLTIFNTNDTTGLKTRFAGAAVLEADYGQWFSYKANDFADGVLTAFVSVIGTAFEGKSGSQVYTTFEGSIEVNTGGTIELQAAQSTGDPTDSTILKLTSLILIKLN